MLTVSCKTTIKYPEGGFDYPRHITGNDTNNYRYQLKGLEPELAAFRNSYVYLFYQPFDEPNLSIRPREKETFRLTWSTVFGNSILISVNENYITVKKGSIVNLYETDTLRLFETERLHLRVLDRNYPYDTLHMSVRKRKYLDSLIKLTPELFTPAYYHKIFDKAHFRNKEKFNYPITKIPFSRAQFVSFVEQVNALGYWSLPWHIECKSPPVDGFGYTLEANTNKKYKIVSSIDCPGDTTANATAFIKVCRKLVTLARMDKEIQLDNTWSMDTVKLTY